MSNADYVELGILLQKAFQLTAQAQESIYEQQVFCTGVGPLSVEDIETLLSYIDPGAIAQDNIGSWGIRSPFTNDDAAQFVTNIDIIVIGQQNFDTAFLRYSLPLSQSFEYMAQEDFLNLLGNGEYPKYRHGDQRIKEHDGLSYLASIGFRWPSTEVVLSSEPSQSNNSTQLREKSELSERGYSVARDVSLLDRRLALIRCVNELGLELVAVKIAWFARNRKRQQRDSQLEAIRRWEEDLQWLKSHYYDNSGYIFTWPWS